MLLLMLIFGLAGALTAWILNRIRFNNKPCPTWLKWVMSSLFLILTIPLSIVAVMALIGLQRPNVYGAVIFVLVFHSMINSDVKKSEKPVASDNKLDVKERGKDLPRSPVTNCPVCLSDQPTPTNFCANCGSKLAG